VPQFPSRAMTEEKFSIWYAGPTIIHNSPPVRQCYQSQDFKLTDYQVQSVERARGISRQHLKRIRLIFSNDSVGLSCPLAIFIRYLPAVLD
jgi:hypothetical protein